LVDPALNIPEDPSGNVEELLHQAREVLTAEAEGILNLIPRLDAGFAGTVDLICRSTGRVIVAGIGKSGIIGRKFVATFNSTGTRSLFLHPVEAMHGDLGMVCPDDILLALSNSGETDELNLLIPSIRRIGCAIVAMTGNPRSTLGRLSDIVIHVGVDREACPMGLAPTTSTTALLAMGDALAVVLIRKKRFQSSDFKRFHPGGALGQRLSMKVADFMLTRNLPLVSESDDMGQVIAVMDQVSLGQLDIRVRLEPGLQLKLRGRVDVEAAVGKDFHLELAHRSSSLTLPPAVFRILPDPAA